MARKIQSLLCSVLLFWLAPATATTLIDHQIQAKIAPSAGRLEATDRITLPAGRTSWTFYLDANLSPEVVEGAASLTPIAREFHLIRWRLERDSTAPRSAPVTLAYTGAIRHGLEDLHEGMGRARQWSLGTISGDGAFLDGQSGWYPTSVAGAANELLTFDLEVTLPPDWLAVAQGAGPQIAETADGVRVSWHERHPQDEIHLIAAPFERYSRRTPIAEAQVYLRTPDKALAERYLDATADYLALYDHLIGPYPYAKFALVENFWESGYGMPSFTLLGPRVLRLPFIIHTSYPHEILHNWWGNGVYVDYASGNWSEGLTTYLSDHLLREQQGKGADYRRDALKGYMDYVDRARDFPLREFRGRHGSASQAIGYGKTMMMVHMLRRELGDATFIAGLRRFYANNRFRVASFADLRDAFAKVSGRDLDGFFQQWIERTGAPTLALRDVQVDNEADGFHLRGELIQTQDSAPFALAVPLLVHDADGVPIERTLAMTGRRAAFDIALPTRPVRLAVDPSFDLFRRLVPGEAPVTLSALLGASRGLILLPADADRTLAAAYRRLAEAWQRGQPGWQVEMDANLQALPSDRPVWLLGWENRFLAGAADGADVTLDPAARHARLAGGAQARAGEGLAMTLSQGERPIGWLAASDARTIEALARKVPHYGRYSYLVFARGSAENLLKGQWPAGETALTVWLDRHHPKLNWPAATPLVAK
ncbi:hypothetical protein Thimo_1476 [Thioflavicoccus mobilis 8321]|uniref:Peptidase M1 membrane alanine aminopeptidase domain-containing protein n=1 Tax=Thioflavicoccus mobilis 8321 TaxID=765912 RepID=L0GWA0_9GAMM|nr:M1 family aminopeptidase [Thioflavicoccus mobilis]AGA90266.1 hypothetical protein Thimo_1476 [Thioflavicoccus mobilis 8321]